MDKTQLASSSNNFQAPPNKPHASSKQNSLPTLSALLQTSQAKPITTSTKPRSPSREARKDERPYKRVPMEEELNQSSEPRYQSLKTQEQEIKKQGGLNRGHTHMNLPIYMQIEMAQGPKNNGNQAFAEEKEEAKSDNNGAGLNNSLVAEQGLADLATSIMDTAMLACLEGTKVAEIQKRFFSSKNICLLCGNHVLRKFKGHIKDHMKEKKSIKSDYSFCLHADGQSLQVKCNKCQKPFSKVTVKKLEEHNEACNSDKIIQNKQPLESMIDDGRERLEEQLEGKIKALKDEITSLDTRLEKTEVKVNGVFRTQESMKKKLNDTDKRVTGVEQNLKTVEEKVENHENVLVGLLKQLIGQGIGHCEKSEELVKKNGILARVKMSDKAKNESKEEERERERSRERARNGSQERRTARQVSERPEERKMRRREDCSEERSQDKRQTTRYDNKGRQLGQYKDSARRY